VLLPLTNHIGEEWEFYALNVLNTLDHEECIDAAFGEEKRKRLLQEDAALLDPEDLQQLLAGVAAGNPYPYLAPVFVPDRLGEPTFFRVRRLPGTLFVLDHVGALAPGTEPQGLRPRPFQ